MNKWHTPNTPGSGYICKLLRVPNSEQFLAIVNGALGDLCKPWYFEQNGDLTPEQTADLFSVMYDSYVQNRGCMIGTIFAYATTSAPIGSLACDGSSHLRIDYPDLYAVIDSAFITDGDHFITPDLRSRGVIGSGQGPGLTNRAFNEISGEERHTLDIGEIPSHGHSFYYTPVLVVAPGDLPINSLFGALQTGTAYEGGDGSHNNMQPYRALRYAIWAR